MAKPATGAAPAGTTGAVAAAADDGPLGSASCAALDFDRSASPPKNLLGQLRRVPQRQQIIIEVVCFFVLGIIWGILTLVKPRQRSWSVGDPDIDKSLKASIFPSWTVPIIIIFGNAFVFFVVEAVVRRQQPLQPRFYVRMLVFCMALGLTVNATGVVTELLKVSVGRLRPNFLAQCQPVLANNSTSTYVCSRNPRDARVSFPSGHSSETMCACVHAALYLYFSLSTHWPLAGKLFPLLPLILGTIVGISRFIDHHHNLSDVFTGFLIGIFFAVVFFAAHYRLRVQWPSRPLRAV